MTQELMIQNNYLSVDDVQRQVNEIQKLMKNVLQDKMHYGVVPGCGDKPALLKAGAEKLCMMFRLIPSFEIAREDGPGEHRTYTVTTTLCNQGGVVMGQGLGICSTLETKYRYVGGGRKCPECGKESIIKGKAEYGGGYLCFAKKGGCGAKFKDGDAAIEGQQTGKVERPDMADTYNTVIKMAKKRSLVDATITATAASDIFTQDIDENLEGTQPPPAAPQPTQPAKVQRAEEAIVEPFYYDIHEVPGAKLSKAQELLRLNKARSLNEWDTVWESPVAIDKLVDRRISKEEAHGN